MQKKNKSPENEPPNIEQEKASILKEDMDFEEKKTDVKHVEFQIKGKPGKTAREPMLAGKIKPGEEILPQLSVEEENAGAAESIIASGTESSAKNATGRARWLPITGGIVGGIVVGLILAYVSLIMPLQNQLHELNSIYSSGNSSSNQIKSDLSNIKLKQQEMQTRYLSALDQLESANQYIFLLQMKEQIAITRLLVEQKEGLKARQSLSEIQTRFEHLKPYLIKKNAVIVKKVDDLIKISIQHLASDPESVKTDLEEINIQLNEIESTLFQVE
jgi:hypothetical protein